VTAAERRFEQGVRVFSLGCGNLLGEFEAAIEADPSFAMGHLGKAWIFALATDPGATSLARAIVATARDLPMDARGKAHLAALDLVLGCAWSEASRLLDRYLMDRPLDLLAHVAGFLIDLFLGNTHNLRDRAARALPFWSSSMEDYAALLGFHAFGLEENGAYERAEEQSRRVAEAEPLSFWAHHTVTHVMEMQGRPEDGLGWMLAREALWSSPDHLTQTHIWWHRALFHLELGQVAEALEIYDGPLTGTQRPLGVSLTNASALLWRLDMLGHDVSERWRTLAPIWAGHADGRSSVFCDLHALMAELGAGDDAGADRRVHAMRATAAVSDEAGAIFREAGVPLGEGLTQFQRGAYAQAAETLFAARPATRLIGGSHAQRDIADWTLTEAALRCGQRDMAVALAYERLALRPRSTVNRAFLRRAEGIRA
jgi:tetratricopeptide (TPR) repeat protein